MNKFCKDCRWVKIDVDIWQLWRCESPKVGINLVHGGLKEVFCYDCRRLSSSCSTEGRWWEAK